MERIPNQFNSLARRYRKVSDEKITDNNTAADVTGTEAHAGTDNNQADSRTFSQEDVDRIVQNRLKQVERKYEGINVDEYHELRQAKLEQEKQSMIKREQFEELLQQQKSEYESTLKGMRGELERVHVDGALLNAAAKHKAVNPEHVANLLKSQVRLGEGNTVEVLDKDGNVRYNTQTATPVSLDELVGEFIQSNQYFRAPAPAGTGSGGNINSKASREVSISDLDMKNPEHRAKYKEIRKSMGIK